MFAILVIYSTSKSSIFGLLRKWFPSWRMRTIMRENPFLDEPAGEEADDNESYARIESSISHI